MKLIKQGTVKLTPKILIEILNRIPDDYTISLDNGNEIETIVFDDDNQTITISSNKIGE